MLRNTLNLVLFSFIFVMNGLSQADNAKLEWADFAGGAGYEYNFGLCVDKLDNTYTTGWYEQTVDFDPSITIDNHTAVGGKDVLIRKLDPNKNLIWAKSFGSSGFDAGTSITTDSTGNVISSGYFSDTTDFDPGTGVYSLIPIGTRDRFIHKMDENGNFLWAFSIENSHSAPTQIVTTDSMDNIYLTCWVIDTVDFDPGPGVFNINGVNTSSNGIIAKYDPNGNFLWAKTLVGTSSAIRSISTDSQGNIIAGGGYSGTVDFDPGAGVSSKTSAGSSDGFLLKLDSLGNFVWVKFISGSFSTGIFDFKLSEGDSIFMTGPYRSTVDFDPGPGLFSLTSSSSTGNTFTNIYMSKWDPNGNFIWVKDFGSKYTEYAKSIILDDQNNLYVTGGYDGRTDFDPSPTGVYILDITNVSNFDDEFVVKLTTHGDFIWAKRFEGSLTSLEIALDNSNNLYVSSGYSSTMDFDPGFNILNQSANFLDMFLLKFTPCSASYGIDTVQACSATYIWMNGITYFTNNNTGKAVLLNSTGCDSIVTLNLTFGANNTGTHVISACNQYTWIDGNTYSSSNSTATHLLSNSSGCDSLITLNLTINSPNSGTDVISSCYPITWIDGNTYANSNYSASTILTNVNGCDSLVTLNFTLNTPNSGTDVLSVCDSLNWIDGNTYTSNNNTATHLLTNVNGCDSLVTLNLTVGNSTSATDIQTACNSFVWIDGNTYTTNNSSATFTLINASGCDSVVSLNLTIDPNTNITQSGVSLTADITGATYQWVECPNYTVIDSATNQTYTANTNGSYAVIVNDNGCIDTSACITVNNVGLSENDLESDVVVYPNPSRTGMFIIGHQGELSEIIMVDLVGRRVQVDINLKNGEIDASRLVLGKYLLSFKIDGKTVIREVVLL